MKLYPAAKLAKTKMLASEAFTTGNAKFVDEDYAGAAEVRSYLACGSFLIKCAPCVALETASVYSSLIRRMFPPLMILS
jgi:hypothetical protein